MASFRKRNQKWQVRIQRKDQPGLSKSFHQLSDAKIWARQKERELDLGIQFNHSTISLREALIRYQKEILPQKKNTRPDFYRINLILKQSFTKKKLTSVDSSDISAFRDQLISESKSANTIRLYLAILSHLFTIAQTEWNFNHLSNPVAKIRKPKLPYSRDRRLSDSEIHRICQNTQSRLLPILIHVALDTGMRLSEICKLNHEAIDLDQKVIHLEETKNNHNRKIPMTEKVFKILKKRICNGLDPFNILPHSVTVAFNRAAKRAKINGACFHTLRHEAISRMFEIGLNHMEVSSISGHQSLLILRRYTHYNIKFLRDKLAQ